MMTQPVINMVRRSAPIQTVMMTLVVNLTVMQIKGLKEISDLVAIRQKQIEQDLKYQGWYVGESWVLDTLITDREATVRLGWPVVEKRLLPFDFNRRLEEYKKEVVWYEPVQKKTFIDGRLEEVGVWNRRLTPKEIVDLISLVPTDTPIRNILNRSTILRARQDRHPVQVVQFEIINKGKI